MLDKTRARVMTVIDDRVTQPIRTALLIAGLALLIACAALIRAGR